MKHKHHVIPRYEGGTDDPSNLVELTPTQHAMWHFAEWTRKKRWQDEKAWKGLAGLWSHRETAREAVREGGRAGGSHIRDNKLGIFGRSKEQHTLDSKSGNVKGGWWNNGVTQGKYLDPPEGWVPGRLPGSMSWWNNGETNRRQVDCPGVGWVKGRKWVPHNKK